MGNGEWGHPGMGHPGMGVTENVCVGGGGDQVLNRVENTDFLRASIHMSTLQHWPWLE